MVDIDQRRLAVLTLFRRHKLSRGRPKPYDSHESVIDHRKISGKVLLLEPKQGRRQMKALTIAVAVIGGLAFASTASACPFMGKDKKDDKTAEAPILKPAA